MKSAAYCHGVRGHLRRVNLLVIALEGERATYARIEKGDATCDMDVSCLRTAHARVKKGFGSRIKIFRHELYTRV